MIAREPPGSALTREEWERFLKGPDEYDEPVELRYGLSVYGPGDFELVGYIGVIVREEDARWSPGETVDNRQLTPPDLLAALLLRGYFRWEDVDGIHEMLGAFVGEEPALIRNPVLERYNDLTDRIARLLPPRDLEPQPKEDGCGK